jgi:membrane protease YdiL (CAAX protease family)
LRATICSRIELIGKVQFRGAVAAAVFLICTCGARGAVIPASAPADQTIGDEAIIQSQAEPQERAELGAYFWCMFAASVVGLTIFIRRRMDRLPIEAHHDGVSPQARLVFYFAMLLASWIGAHLAAIASGVTLGEPGRPPLSLADEARLTIGVVVSQAAVVAAYEMLRRRRAAHDGVAPSSNQRAAMIALGGIALAWPLVSVVAIFGSWLRRDNDPVAHETLRRLTESDDRSLLVLMAALVVVAGPILEEFVYRGLLQRALRQVGLRPWHAIIASSLLFAVMHWGNSDPQAVAALLVFSLALGWAFERSGSLLAPIIMHSVFNLANLMMAMWLVE